MNGQCLTKIGLNQPVLQHGGRISGDQYCILISIYVSLKEFEDNNQILTQRGAVS